MNTARPNKFMVFLLGAAIVMSMTVVSLVVDDGRNAHAATVAYNLTVDATTITMPDGEAVFVWGFGLDGGPITVPGPVLEVSEGDDLVINITNNLAEPVTVAIPGQTIENPTPVMDGGRVRSFTPESASVTFPNVSAGTYLYESGTHPAKQVQMGLYGALVVHPATPGRAYNDPVSDYDTEHIVVLSDIDPDLHKAVESGAYGTPAYPSTVNLRPRYFLINGKAYPRSDALAAANGDTVLLRFLNAGMQTYYPTISGTSMTCIALDGNLLPFPQRVNSLILPAGQTKDALVAPDDNTRYAFYERGGALSNAGDRGVGGMLTHLLVGEALTQPHSVIDDIGYFRSAGWKFDVNGSRVSEAADESIAFGLSTDTPIMGDWNGDGVDDIGVFRGGNWFLDANGSGAWDAGDRIIAFGLPSDTPIIGDWNGDGTDVIGVYRDANWFVDANNNGAWDVGDLMYAFGLPTDTPIIGDWNNDGADEIGVFRDGVFYFDNNGNALWDAGDTWIFFGLATDTPVIGDWNGDGKDEIGVFRNDGTWSLDINGDGLWSGVDAYFTYGDGTDIPLTGNR